MSFHKQSYYFFTTELICISPRPHTVLCIPFDESREKYKNHTFWNLTDKLITKRSGFLKEAIYIFWLT